MYKQFSQIPEAGSRRRHPSLHPCRSFTQMASFSDVVAASLAHDIKSPLNFVAFSASKMQKLVKEQNYEVANTLAEHIAESVGTICKHLDSLTLFYEAQFGICQMPARSINLYELVHNVADLFKSVLMHHQNCFVNLLPTDLMIKSNPQILAIIIRNLIDNAVKNSHGGTVTVAYQSSPAEKKIVISDDGKGMPEPVAQWLTSNRPDLKPAGLGLWIVRELATIADIRINVEISQGTKVTLVFQS